MESNGTVAESIVNSPNTFSFVHCEKCPFSAPLNSCEQDLRLRVVLDEAILDCRFCDSNARQYVNLKILISAENLSVA